MIVYFSHEPKIRDLTHLLFILLKEFANLFEVFKNFWELVLPTGFSFIRQHAYLLNLVVKIFKQICINEAWLRVISATEIPNFS
jgi:hypothetical protein